MHLLIIGLYTFSNADSSQTKLDPLQEYDLQRSHGEDIFDIGILGATQKRCTPYC